MGAVLADLAGSWVSTGSLADHTEGDGRRRGRKPCAGVRQEMGKLVPCLWSWGRGCESSRQEQPPGAGKARRRGVSRNLWGGQPCPPLGLNPERQVLRFWPPEQKRVHLCHQSH